MGAGVAAKAGGGKVGAAIAERAGGGKVGAAIAAKAGRGKVGAAIAAKAGRGKVGAAIDRKSVVEGKRVDLGGRRIIKKKTIKKTESCYHVPRQVAAPCTRRPPRSK